VATKGWESRNFIYCAAVILPSNNGLKPEIETGEINLAECTLLQNSR
jgi:hypothetical protein